jgi:hypothetical protein
VVHLRLRARNLERRLGRTGVAIAERDGRNLRRRPEVAFEQRRRHALHVGDVVEAGAHRVGRQEGVDVDVEIEELADGARVLGAIEALEHPAPGVRVRGRRGVDAGLERHRERLQRFRVGAPRAGRRHHAGAQLADHLLADFRVIRDLRDVERRER